MSEPTELSTDLRNRVFRYRPYIAIFGDNEPETPVETEGATA